jgi:hypothetical protein
VPPGQPGKVGIRRPRARTAEGEVPPLASSQLALPRDPRFAERAGPILDLYQRRWEGRPLGAHDYVISADEKTSIQARERRHSSAPVAPGQALRVAHEYRRQGAWADLAAWDVHRARLFGRCEPRPVSGPLTDSSRTS